MIGAFVQGASVTKSCIPQHNVSSLPCPEHLDSTSCPLHTYREADLLSREECLPSVYSFVPSRGSTHTTSYIWERNVCRVIRGNSQSTYIEKQTSSKKISSEELLPHLLLFELTVFFRTRSLKDLFRVPILNEILTNLCRRKLLRTLKQTQSS